jgi:hypothetical protein
MERTLRQSMRQHMVHERTANLDHNNTIMMHTSPECTCLFAAAAAAGCISALSTTPRPHYELVCMPPFSFARSENDLLSFHWT